MRTETFRFYINNEEINNEGLALLFYYWLSLYKQSMLLKKLLKAKVNRTNCCLT